MSDMYTDPRTGKVYKKVRREITMDDGTTYYKEDLVDYYSDWDEDSKWSDKDTLPYEDLSEQYIGVAPSLPPDMNTLPLEKQVELLRLHYRTLQDMFDQLASIISGVQTNIHDSYNYTERNVEEIDRRFQHVRSEIYDLYHMQRLHDESWHSLLIPTKKEDKDESDIS